MSKFKSKFPRTCTYTYIYLYIYISSKTSLIAHIISFDKTNEVKKISDQNVQPIT